MHAIESGHYIRKQSIDEMYAKAIGRYLNSIDREQIKRGIISFYLFNDNRIIKLDALKGLFLLLLFCHLIAIYVCIFEKFLYLYK